MSPLLDRVLVLGLVLLLAACGSPAEEVDSSAEGAPETTDQSQPGTELSAAGLRFVLPGGWTSEIPSSSMRMAQATIPGEAGPGQLSAFFFGPGGGGGVDANLQRWSSQVVLDEGEQEQRESFQSGDLTITWVDLSGTLKASQIGSFPTTDQPGYRLFAAVIEGPGGPWFFRVVGPQATLAAERDAFVDMLRSAEVASG